MHGGGFKCLKELQVVSLLLKEKSQNVILYGMKMNGNQWLPKKEGKYRFIFIIHIQETATAKATL